METRAFRGVTGNGAGDTVDDDPELRGEFELPWFARRLRKSMKMKVIVHYQTTKTMEQLCMETRADHVWSHVMLVTWKRELNFISHQESLALLLPPRSVTHLPARPQPPPRLSYEPKPHPCRRARQ